jgi:hypothetical protein
METVGFTRMVLYNKKIFGQNSSYLRYKGKILQDKSRMLRKICSTKKLWFLTNSLERQFITPGEKEKGDKV